MIAMKNFLQKKNVIIYQEKSGFKILLAYGEI